MHRSRAAGQRRRRKSRGIVKPPIRAIGFDLGETLFFYRDTPLNWASLYPDALGAVARVCGASPSPEQFAAAGQILRQHNTRIVPRTREVSAGKILSPILKAWSLDPTAHLSAAIETFFRFFQQHLCVYPETASVLTALRERHIPTGILTDVPYGMPRAFVQCDLADAGLSNLFDALLTSVEVGVRKPEAAGYRELAAHLGVEPREMLYVGNEAKDVIGANRAGAQSAFLDRENTGASHGQDFTISTLAGVCEIMRNTRAVAVELRT